MAMWVSVLLAQAEGSPSAPAPLWWNLAPLGALLIVLVVNMLLRGNRDKREAEFFQKGLRKNDRVLTSAGIFGVVSSLPEVGDEVTLKIDESARLKVTRSSIQRNLTREEEAAAAREQKK